MPTASDASVVESQAAWLTDEIRAALAAIRGPHVEKKRKTVLLVAFAKANGEPLKPLFERTDTCAESIWWGKWSHQPDIRAALAVCETQALAWADAETVSIEQRYRTERRRSVAKWAAKAPDALAAVMAGMEQRGSDRINAAVTLIKLADPDTTGGVGMVQGGGDTSQTVQIDVSRLTDDQLDRILAGEPPATVVAATGGGGEGATAPGGAG